MASKKKSKRYTTKAPKKITGLEASLLSFRARNGAILPDDAVEFVKYVSPHVRRIIFGGEKTKSKTGQKTLERIRKVAEANGRDTGLNSKRPAVNR
jgi:hypothetical protein